MIDLELCFTPAVELARRIRSRDLSPVALMDNTLARIEQQNARLNCFCFVYADEAMALARAAEDAVTSGARLGPLHGIPVAVKDVTPTAGKTTTGGSYLYEHWVPERDAIIVERLRAAGAIMVGKTTTPEFAYDSFTRSPLWGVTCNPWDTRRTPGGSSGGSGAAVASGCVSIAEGTDMGGSVRIPASFCGLVGLKPSLGRIPMDILPTVFDNISHFGPLTRTVADANLFMNVLSGPDERDIMSLPERLQLPLPAASEVRGLRLALCPGLGYYALDTEVEQAVREAAAQLADLGAQVEEISLPWDERINEAWLANWGVYLSACFTDGDITPWRERMDPNVVELIDAGTRMKATDLKRIEILRTRQWHQLCEVFEHHDALLCATTSRTAPPNDATDAEFSYRDARGWHGLDLTGVFNFVAQCPALSVPCGVGADGLPIGLQVVGRRFAEDTVMRIAGALESARPWAVRRPPA